MATFSLPTTVDAVDANPSVSCSRLSGSVFPLGTTTVTCSAADEASNASSASFSITVQDTRSPTIEKVETVLDAKKKNVTEIVLTFSEEVRDAESLGHYALSLQGGKKPTPIALSAALYDAPTRTVRLRLRKPLAVSQLSKAQLTVSGGTSLTDLSGNLLDGDRDGRPGGNYLGLLSQATPRSAATSMSATSVDQMLATGDTAHGLLVGL